MSLLCNTCLQLILLGLPAEPAQPVPGNSTSEPIYVESVYVQPAAAPAASEPPAPRALPSSSQAAAGVHPVSPVVVARPPASMEVAPGAGPVVPAASGVGDSVAAQNQVRALEQQLRLTLLATRQTGRTGEAVLVVPSTPVAAQSMDPLVEDLTVMSRIIQKNLADGYLLPEMSATDSLIINLTMPSQNVGPRLLFPLSRRLKPMYVSGYGALFFLQVDFPLVPPAEQQEQARAEESDPVWSEARRMLYEPPSAGLANNASPRESYSEDKVALLRGRLIELLRHATNIRTLDPNDSVTIVVRGTGTGDRDTTQDPLIGLPTETSCGRTVLTLRARKPDIDLYAKGQLEPDQFEQRLQITNYRQ